MNIKKQNSVIRLAIFVTHPVQYQVPIFRTLAKEPGLQLVVHFFSDHSIRGGIDPGFGVPVAWDIPMLDGYEHIFITRDQNLNRPSSVRLPHPRQLLDKGHFEYVFIQGYTHAFERQLIRAARATQRKVVMRGEFTDVPRKQSKLKSLFRTMYLKWFYSYVDSFCYIGTESRLHLERLGIETERMFFSPYAVDDQLLEAHVQKFKRTDCRLQLGLSPEHFTIMFSGKLIPRKAPLLLAEAICFFPEREKLALVILGDGSQKAELITKLKPVLGKRLIMPGFVNQSLIGQYFAAADVFVLPSEYETWGLVVNEAMQFSLPVIVSDKVGCHRDLVKDGKTGFVFPSGNAKALLKHLQRLKNDRLLTQKMGRQARKHISGFTVEAAAKGILRALGLHE